MAAATVSTVERLLVTLFMMPPCVAPRSAWPGDRRLCGGAYHRDGGGTRAFRLPPARVPEKNHPEPFVSAFTRPRVQAHWTRHVKRLLTFARRSTRGQEE